MIGKFAYTVIFAMSSVSIFAAAGESLCSANEGAKIEFSDVAQTFASLQSIDPEKDEFETQSEYENRLSQSASQVGLPSGLVLEAEFYGSNIAYDAELQSLLIGEYQLSESSSLAEVPYSLLTTARLPDGYKWADEGFISFDKYDVDLAHQTPANSSEQFQYQAQNAYGAEVTVTFTASDNFVVVDSPTIKSITMEQIYEWSDELYETETAVPFWEYNHEQVADPGSVFETRKTYLKVPLDPSSARAMKDGLKFAVVANPKFPYFYKSEQYVEATYSSPLSGVLRYFALIADIECGLITDENGNLLTVVERGGLGRENEDTLTTEQRGTGGSTADGERARSNHTPATPN